LLLFCRGITHCHFFELLGDFRNLFGQSVNLGGNIVAARTVINTADFHR